MPLEVTSGKQPEPPRILIYGKDGIGKTTWAAQSPKPIFLDTERSTARLSVDRLSPPTSAADVSQAIADLANEDHDYKTLVIDSIDWLQAPLFDAIAKRAGNESIEDFGYGKGYILAEAAWGKMLSRLSDLSDSRNMAIVLVGHAATAKRRTAALEEWDAVGPDLHKRLAPLTKEWATEIFYAHRDEHVIEEKAGYGAKNKRGTASGRRLLGTEETAGYDAKNRLDTLPAVLEMTMDACNFWDLVAEELGAEWSNRKETPTPAKGEKNE